MKKIFLFATALLAAASINAETVFSWGDKVGTITATGTASLESKVKISSNTTEVPAILFANGYSINSETNEHENYVELTPKEGGFKAGDIIKIEFCFNNTDEKKVATIGIYNLSGEELAASGNGINARTNDGLSSFNYELTTDMDKVRIARAKSGKTNTYIITLSVVRGETVAKKALNPTFSLPSGTYFDPFKVALAAQDEGAKVLYRLNETGDYKEYTDSILIDQYDETTVIEAYATLDGAENSDVAKNSYKLIHFVPRPVFEARTTLNLAGIKTEDIEILSGDNATTGTYVLDGVTVPSVNYINSKALDGQDSLMSIGLKSCPGLTLRYKNKDNKSNMLKFANDFTQLEGSNFILEIEGVQGGDTIVFVATTKGSAGTHFDHTYSSSSYLTPYQPEDDEDPCFTDGDIYKEPNARVDEDYIGWTNLVYVVQEGRSKVKIKETKGGARIAKIQIGAHRGEGSALENIGTEATSVRKIMKDGQIYIQKGTQLFNVLGASIAH